MKYNRNNYVQHLFSITLYENSVKRLSTCRDDVGAKKSHDEKKLTLVLILIKEFMKLVSETL